MRRSQGYLRHLSILLLLALYSVQRVSAIQCYACDSRKQPMCSITAKDTLAPFIVDCPVYMSRSSSNSTLSQQVDAVTLKLEYECAYSKGISTLNGIAEVMRGCVLKPVTCDTYKIHYAAVDARGDSFQMDSCERCNSDLCNSSGHLSTGIWSLTLSLIALYFIKF